MESLIFIFLITRHAFTICTTALFQSESANIFQWNISYIVLLTIFFLIRVETKFLRFQFSVTSKKSRATSENWYASFSRLIYENSTCREVCERYVSPVIAKTRQFLPCSRVPMICNFIFLFFSKREMYTLTWPLYLTRRCRCIWKLDVLPRYSTPGRTFLR